MALNSSEKFKGMLINSVININNISMYYLKCIIKKIAKF